MKQVKTSKSPKSGSGHGDWHASHSSMGMGDYYGTGIRAKVGRMRSGTGMKEITPEELKVPPKSVV